MRIPNVQHARHPWVIAQIAPDFDLLDAWALPVVGERADFERFLDCLSVLNLLDEDGSSLSGALFRVRLRLGALLGWDDPTRERTIPGCAETTLRARVPVHLRATADTHLFDGPLRRAGGGLVPLYRTDDEAAAEIANDTVHGVLHLGWVEQRDGRYRAQLGIYVKPRGALGRMYLRFIGPFRHLIVYPALERRIGQAWARVNGTATAGGS